ncbi:PepSY-associated TM helix domain-containing protein [Oceanihabitans sediminis]|uniref:PepSY-associated TM helix domain-containing protein n=1 Tax=Oceanihabitans sediminis TaxID=1812012 RepID=UPI00299F32E7|nr:PepSY-associated TM helix domain-containing protein [Oceanihabitans sediminis]MDX1774696.1 PepSY-associated TM helix domain-containing protein [Oceanihabitans sediminis]
MKNKNTYSFRKFINDLHLWLGLASGIILFIVCFTGTILVFDAEIKSFFAEDFMVEAKAEKHKLTNLTQTLKETNKVHVTGVSIPYKDNEPYTFTVKEDLKERRGTKVLVNPYTKAIHKSEKTKVDTFMFTMFKLHRWLLLDISIGRPIVGVATIIFLLLSISGIVLWFPKKLKWKNIKQGLKIKTKANWKRVNHDLHNTLGFYASIFLLIMAITGLCWSFESYRDGLGQIIGTKIFDRSAPEFSLENKTDMEAISYDAAVALANKTLNYPGELSVSFPSPKSNYYSFRKYAEENWSPSISDKVYIDTYGQLLKVELFDDKPWNQQIASLIRPLHMGDVFGTVSKIIYFLACLIATSLPVTGTIIWLNKLKKKRKRK